MRAKLRLLGILWLLMLPIAVAGAEPFGNSAFKDVWERTDYPVQQGVAGHSWVWGDEPFTKVLREAYANNFGGARDVQYLDKSRMEINNPNAPRNQWYVTNGLLVNEMIQGVVQVGDSKHIPLDTEPIAIAGDPENTYPTYRSLERLFRFPMGRKLGDHVVEVFLPEGAGVYPQYADSQATEIVRMEQGFGIPRAFWDFMNQRGTIYQGGRYVRNQQLFDWLYVMGYPTTDAMWTKVRVGGVEREVMFQAFERRLLTYTPSNAAAWRVEMGNVGRHYYQWRYVAPFLDEQHAIITVPSGTQPIVTSPLQVRGFEDGTSFEASITIRLRVASTGFELAKVSTTVMRPDILIAGPFEATLNYTAPVDTVEGELDVLIYSARDGAEILLERMEVVIKGSSTP